MVIELKGDMAGLVVNGERWTSVLMPDVWQGSN